LAQQVGHPAVLCRALLQAEDDGSMWLCSNAAKECEEAQLDINRLFQLNGNFGDVAALLVSSCWGWASQPGGWETRAVDLLPISTARHHPFRPYSLRLPVC